MKTRSLLVSFFIPVLTALYALTVSASENPNPVVVELFTSEACSSCPPADALLMQLGQQHTASGAEVIILGEHVDYFNHLGWADRFSSPLFTARQNTYVNRFQLASAYTPQMVIDGRFEALGSDPLSVQHEIAIASRTTKMAIVVLNWTGQNTVRVNVTGAGVEPSAVLLAITEDGLTTSVPSGENGGRVLRHSGVVRELRQLGEASNGVFAGTSSIVPANNWSRGNLRVVVFVQKQLTREIIGAATSPFR